ncbi:MAG TPA: SDR family oxidoreductase [Bryobacteraceae bacterium]|nr:SDR family oxidoreductase [Bryobacteraceae bacterium]
MDHTDQVAIVTGGASGIGGAAVDLLKQRGARVFSFDVHGDPTHRVDVANSGQARDAVEEIASQCGRIDAVIASAGVQAYGTALTTTDEEWDRVLNINLRGVWNVARAALPHMQKAGGGSIVVVSSVQGLATQNNVFAYSTSKHALLGLTRSMAVDFAADGIRVNCVCPGTVDTPMLAWSAGLDEDPESVYRACREMHPLGRIAKPEEIAEVLCFLAHPAASFVTGAVWTVDGGLLTRIGGVPKVQK